MMLRVTCLIFVSLVLVTEISVVSCGDCVQLSETSGTITNEKTASTYTKCWRIIVPQNSQVKINFESFSSSRYDCSATSVEISLDNNDGETHIFCPNERRWEQLILKGDITVTHRMSVFYEPFQSSFTLKYQIENLCSEGSNIICDPNGVCSIESLQCQVAEQCSDGADGKECGSRFSVAPDLTKNRVKGIERLKKKWSPTTGWQENTHRGVTALFLASARGAKKVNAEETLMIKQLEVQTLVYILRKDTEEMTVNQLSMFVNALTVSCQNPRNFHGHDLVGLLKREIEVSSLITHPVACLALCNARASLPDNVTDNFNKLLKINAKYSFLLDVQAITVMALSCLKSNYEEDLNTSFPQSDYEGAMRKLKELQMDDGSFGNVYSTAVVTQALLSAGEEGNKDWNYNKAVNYLIHHLNSPSVDFLAVYLILPILNGKCLSHIRNTSCKPFEQRDPVSDVKAKLGPKMRVQYTLNIGDEKNVVHTLSLRVPQNVTVFEVMQLAQDADAKYKFLGKQMGENMFIYDIAGITNDFEDGKFWLPYVGKDAESVRFTKESPDKIVLQDGWHIVMWYKKAHI